MPFAIIKTGGKQYVVRPGSKIQVEKLLTLEGQEVIFDKVLLIGGEEGKENLIGTPYVEDYIVRAKVLKQGKGEKIISYKYKAKKRYHRKIGHRQLYSEVEILEILQGGIEKSVAKETVGTKKTSKASAAKRRPKTEETKREK